MTSNLILTEPIVLELSGERVFVARERTYTLSRLFDCAVALHGIPSSALVPGAHVSVTQPNGTAWATTIPSKDKEQDK
jgi:hypothetical protein